MITWFKNLLKKTIVHAEDYRIVEQCVSKFLCDYTIKVKTSDYTYVLPSRKEILKFLAFYKTHLKYVEDKRDCDDFVKILLGKISAEAKGWAVAGIEVEIGSTEKLHKLVLFIDSDLICGYIDAQLCRIVNEGNCYVPVSKQKIEF